MAKAFFYELLEVEPYGDDAYYIAFKVGNQDIDPGPNGHREAMTVYYHVYAGARQVQEIEDVGDVGRCLHQK